MGIGVVTVTYGNRFEYVSQLIKYIKNTAEISKAVIVTNGIDDKVAQQITSEINENDKFIVFSFHENSGSAKGFKKGIEIIKDGVEFIWLLDDDNLPQMNALKELITAWDKLKLSSFKDALLSYRPDRDIYKQAISHNNPYKMLGTKNSFLGFNLMDKLHKKNSQIIDANIGIVAVAPYGGMFFHKRLIDNIGLPNERFFLYADDHDFSYRITQKGGNIILITDSVVDDLEKSFHLKKKSLFSSRFTKTNSYNAIFFGARNNIIFERNFITNYFIYSLNKYFYLCIIFILLLINGENHKFKIILKAVKESNEFVQKLEE